jgi:hypothetical protein
MGKISWFKALGMVGLLAAELTEAGQDNRITVDEALRIATDLAKASGIGVDTVGMELTVDILTDITAAAADGKITIKEVLDLTEKICDRFGIPFDKTGLTIPAAEVA